LLRLPPLLLPPLLLLLLLLLLLFWDVGVEVVVGVSALSLLPLFSHCPPAWPHTWGQMLI